MRKRTAEQSSRTICLEPGWARPKNMPLLRALARCWPGKASARRTEAGNGGTSQPAWIEMKIKHAREKTNGRTESWSVDGSESRKNKSQKAGKTNRQLVTRAGKTREMNLTMYK
jgi:hypothetical protein